MALKKFYNIDFSTVRADLKAYFEANSDFKDYNFEGSALAQLLDVMAFTNQQQNFYLNMTMNELFMATAQMTDNVYKLANMLNYMPKRKSAPYSTVDIQRQQLMVNGEDWDGLSGGTPPTGWNDDGIPGGFGYALQGTLGAQSNSLKITSTDGAADYVSKHSLSNLARTTNSGLSSTGIVALRMGRSLSERPKMEMTYTILAL